MSHTRLGGPTRTERAQATPSPWCSPWRRGCGSGGRDGDLAVRGFDLRGRQDEDRVGGLRVQGQGCSSAV